MSTGEDRAVGALLGLAAGDATGTTLEFRAPGTFEPITDIVGGGPFGLPRGAWTDDTSMALCLAESLLDTAAMDLDDQMRRYAMWSQDGYLSSNGTCFDIGNATSTQLARYLRTGDAVDPTVDPAKQANGSLMRLAPVPIRWFADLEQAAAMAAESSLPTHNARTPVDACRAMGAVVAGLVHGREWAEVTAPDFWAWGELDPAIAAVVAGSFRTLPDNEIRGTGHCVRALEAALWSVDGAADVRDAVLRAANLGDDADTTAAIAGQLAGARWGASGLPESWRADLVLSQRIAELARQLYRAGGGGVDQSVWPHDAWFHAYWVEPGRVLAGEYPGDRDPVRASAKVNLLLDAGVRTFVDLTTDDDHLEPYATILDQAAAARGLAVTRHGYPVPDMGVLAEADYDPIIEAIRGAAPGVTFVHCWGGIGRTGTVVGCLLVDDGLGYEQAVARIDDLRATSRKASYEVPQSRPQHDVLRRRASRRQ